MDRYFKEMCQRKLPMALRDAKGRHIYIWGAGVGGGIVEKVMYNLRIPLCGFVDRNADIIKEYQGYPVIKFSDISPETDYLIVSLMKFDCTVYDQIKDTKWGRRDWFYLWEQDFYNEEDLIYMGCRIGRFTYGYEDLLKDAAFASSIGRFCSINYSARIWGEHSTSSITTHPILTSSFCERSVTLENSILKTEAYNDPVKADRVRKDNIPVVIGNDVWIGANVCILPGVTIGDGAIIGAGAIVTHNVEPYAVVGGCPARLIKYRFARKIREKLLEIRWWDWSIDQIEKNIDLFYEPEKFIERF